MTFKKRAHDSTVDLSTYFESMKTRNLRYDFYDPDSSEPLTTLDYALRFNNLDEEIDEDYFESMAADF